MSLDDDPRVRTVRWVDPAALLDAFKTMNGLELLRAVATGKLPPPPIANLLDLRLVSVEPSSVTFEFDPAEYMYSPLGTVHGGVITVLLDSAMGCSFHTTLQPGTAYTTLEIKVNFVRPVTRLSGPMRAEARVVHAGGRVATAEARLVDGQKKLYAHSTSTLMVVPPQATPSARGS